MSTTKVTDAMRNVTQVDAAKITTGTIPDARLPSTLPASSGANLTSLNASNLGSGTVATARLGSGTASSSTFLRGDSTYSAAGGGKVLQCLQTVTTSFFSTTSASYVDVTGVSQAITCAATSSKVLVNITGQWSVSAAATYAFLTLDRGGSSLVEGDTRGSATNCWIHTGSSVLTQWSAYQFSGVYLDSPSSTDEITFKLRMKKTFGGTACIGGSSHTGDGNRANSVTTITLMEIGA